MSAQDERLGLKRPGEQAIIFNPVTGDVLSTDFSPIDAHSEGALQVQNVVDTEKDVALYHVISVAMGRPGESVESNCLFRGSEIHLRVVHLASPVPRTCIFIRIPGG